MSESGSERINQNDVRDLSRVTMTIRDVYLETRGREKLKMFMWRERPSRLAKRHRNTKSNKESIATMQTVRPTEDTRSGVAKKDMNVYATSGKRFSKWRKTKVLSVLLIQK